MHLFDPLTIRGITLKNRIAVSPMCQYSSDDGFASDWHLVHLGQRAVGGAAVVFTEATAVTPEGRISPQDLGIWKDDHVEYMSRIARFLNSHGAVSGVQLAHAGRKASTAAPWKGGQYLSESEGGWRPIYAPSALPFSEKAVEPQRLDKAGLARICKAFGEAAQRVLAAGFQVIELHGAHGYLINEFLSPLSNNRSDEYGGSFENRTRFLREITAEVRRVWPERLPIFLRISATDWTENGWTVEDSVALARMMKPLGVDLFDCSSGGNVPGVRIPVGPGYQIPFSNQVRREASVLTGSVGMITSAAQADQIIRNGEADIVLLAREFLRDPYWPLHAAKVLGVDVPWPNQYLRAKN
jgi:2,4-dienoyl-CoA reductase-like NADH-dependent reductase (Old Yellow Enzyme family)